MRFIPFVFFLLLISAAHAQDVNLASQEYMRCAAMTKTAPEAAITLSEQWQKTGGAQSAQHCRAMALFALKQYKPAAKELEGLADIITEKQPLLWLSVLSQAGKARMAANDLGSAYRNYTMGIGLASEYEQDMRLQPLMVAMLSERSDVFVAMGKPYDAVQDLDHAINLAGHTVDLVLKRAEVFSITGNSAMAQADIMKALSADPDNAQARIMLANLKKTAVIR